MTETPAACLIDTNVLIYSLDPRDLVKQEYARELLGMLEAKGVGVVSTQILGEFYTVATRKLAPVLSAEDALDCVARYLVLWRVLAVTPAVIVEAIRGVREHQMSYWDAQIWAVARIHSIPAVLSEDFSHNSTVGGVRFVNPFRR